MMAWCSVLLATYKKIIDLFFLSKVQFVNQSQCVNLWLCCIWW